MLSSPVSNSELDTAISILQIRKPKGNRNNSKKMCVGRESVYVGGRERGENVG